MKLKTFVKTLLVLKDIIPTLHYKRKNSTIGKLEYFYEHTPHGKQEVIFRRHVIEYEPILNEKRMRDLKREFPMLEIKITEYEISNRMVDNESKYSLNDIREMMENSE